jgi:signal transduction histidine kinase
MDLSMERRIIAANEAEKRNDALRRLEELAAVGQEASTIAHEINNPLESVTNLLYLMKLSESMEEVQQYVNIAQVELARVTEITSQTLRFHRRTTEPTWVDLGALSHSVMAFYTGRMATRKIKMEWRVRMAPRVLAREGELRQVLANLVRNALDAMPESGRLLIRVNPACEINGLRQGVRITVADTGEGIGAEMRGRLFEMFQTSKEGTGTGLGLWVSKGIIEKCGGQIKVRSRHAMTNGNGSGTVFAVWLPVQRAVNLTRVAG